MHQSCLRFSLAALLCSTSVFAQTATQPPAPQPTTPATASSGDLLLTGCLRGSAAAIGTSPGQGMIYTLEVVEVPPAKPSTSAPTAGAVRSDAPTTITYTLSAPDSVGLAKHVDHEVQLTGTMQPPAAKPATPGAAGSSSAPATGKPGGAHRTVQVSALKMISTNCPKK
jgi:hypothetical protein